MISVCMATYNGERFIEEQLNSVLINLNEGDEVIISDDGSTDQTIEIINAIRNKDNRITVLEGPHSGVKMNFENAIKHARGDYIYLCDQDDVWESNKVLCVQSCFAKDVDVVLHNAQIVDTNCESLGHSFFEFRNSKAGILRNIIKNSYIGCCMAFKKELIPYILPIPNSIEMHDQWIGIIGEMRGTVIFLDQSLIKYRRHSSNVSAMKHYPFKKMLRNRVAFILELLRRRN